MLEPKLNHPNLDAPVKVLIIDDDRDTADLMLAVLTDEGYSPSVIYTTDGRAIREAVGRLAPDCVLLDSSHASLGDYGESWQSAAWIAAGERTIPVIMMTAHVAAADEAVAAKTKRARAAEFAAVVRKPFELDDFLATLSGVVTKAASRRASDAEIAERIADLREGLVAAGARGISTSSRRVWAIFHGPNDEDLLQIYWWEKLSLFLVGRYSADGSKLEPVGQFSDLRAAIVAALP